MGKEKRIKISELPDITLMLREIDLTLWIKATEQFQPGTAEEERLKGHWLGLLRHLAISPDAN